MYIFMYSHIAVKLSYLSAYYFFFVLSVTFLFTSVEHLLALLFSFCCFCYYVPYFD